MEKIKLTQEEKEVVKKAALASLSISCMLFSKSFKDREYSPKNVLTYMLVLKHARSVFSDFLKEKGISLEEIEKGHCIED